MATSPPDEDASSAPQVKWDSVHCSPDAKVILVSSDNVSFRVDAWYLSNKSDFVKGLLDIPSSESLENAPIQLQQQARHVRVFIDMVLSSHTAPIILALDDCIPLIQICDQMSAPTLDAFVWRAIAKRLHSATHFNHVTPWDIFQMAAGRNDDQMCAFAVFAFYRHGYTFDDICSQPASFYEGLPTKYVATLLTGNFKWFISHAGDATYKQRGWAVMADRFFKYGKDPKDMYIEKEKPKYG